MITSMNKDGSVDYGAAANLAWTLVADGADGILVNGTTDESPVTQWRRRSTWSGSSRMPSMCLSSPERARTTRRARSGGGDDPGGWGRCTAIRGFPGMGWWPASVWCASRLSGQSVSKMCLDGPDCTSRWTPTGGWLCVWSCWSRR